MGEQQERKFWIRAVAEQLSVDDRVEIEAADKTRTLAVTKEPREVDRRPYRCKGLLVSLEGYGTDYSIEIPDDDRAARLLYPSGPSYGIDIRDLSVEEGTEPALVSNRTAADMGIPER
jgi:hypothetical protein